MFKLKNFDNREIASPLARNDTSLVIARSGATKQSNLNELLSSNKGFSLIEIIIAVVLITLASLSIVQLHDFMARQSTRVKEKSLATQKAMQMMEELRSLVYGAERTDISLLDDFDDGTHFQSTLTTNRDITSPSAPLSGNKNGRYGWRYIRHIEVRRVADDQFARRVFVRVFENRGDFTKVSDNPEKYSVSGTPTTLAEISGILRTIKGNYVPTQVYDIYLVAIENVPGWWTRLSLLRPMVANIIEDLQTRNPGISFKTHWITQMSYGRDTQYKPYLNSTTSSADTALPYVYIYPGNTGVGDYYAANVMNSKFNIDGVCQNADSYSLCDMYNHAVRYPEEESSYNALLAQARAAGTANPEMSWRMLIEKMNSDPMSLASAIILNLHGELVPIPAMRNYSDAAKDPVTHPNKRVVTHPENIQYASGAEVKLRIYPYVIDPNNVSAPATYSPGFKGMYYDNADLTGYTGTNVLSDINSDWGSGRPGSVGLTGSNSFSVVWTSSITPRYSEVYTFYTTTNDGVRLYIDGVLIINSWVTQDPAVQRTVLMPYAFVAGQQYSLRMEYYENTSNASAKLEWQSATQAREVIPSSCSNSYVVATPATTGTWRSTSTISMASIYLPDDTINSGDITVQRLNGNLSGAFAWQALTQPSTNYNLSYPVGGGTLIKLYDLPLIHRSNAAGQGQRATKQLYGYEYIPCPIGADFSMDMTSTADSPKNSARATITFAAGALLNGQHKIETRIGDTYFTSGTDDPPCNLSRTYVWVGQTPPTTELYQFMGDPRHCPYLDIKTNLSFNWYFQSITDASYTGFTNATAGWLDTSSGWGRTSIPIDLPRYFMLIRQGLLSSQSIWSTMNGVSFFYYGQGGEIGNDKDPWPNGVPMRRLPWSSATATDAVTVNEMVRAADVGATLEEGFCVSKKDNTWYAKYWLGELYPDDQYTNWSSSGNLKCDTADSFYRRPFNAIADFGYQRGNCISFTGSASFLNGGTANAFRHEADGGADDDNITALGTAMGTVFNMPMLSQVFVARPFGFTSSTSWPQERALTPYSGIRTTLSIPAISGLNRVFYTTTRSANAITGPFYGNATVKVTQGISTCYMVYSGVSTQGDFGTTQIGKLVLASLLRTFLDSGLYASTQDRIPQVPLVDITRPTSADEFDNPSSIITEWTYNWTRWNQENYTEEYPAGYVDRLDLVTETPVIYSLKYSPDREQTWYHCVDDSIAQFGELSTNPAHFTTLSTYTWDVSAKAGGSYVLMVECYRQDFAANKFPLHHSYDKIGIYIRR
ncbi:MAG: prepilin-type N-terminal cleavage/methylation domain-containing protein [Elusimicrobia bacterium]|nr:prepilin-type N-terminal cleavage/methylation domain-containing protein [Candidatus Liberimonas magnetica]